MAIRSTHVVAFFLLSAIAMAASAGDWPQWRGPEGTGVSRERNLPINWNSERGILWKTEIPEWGDSTPAIWGDAIFVTAQHDDNLLLLRINKADGKIVWTQTVGTGTVKRSPIKAKSADERREQKFHDKQNMASPSPVTNGKVVVVHFGNGELAAYDFDGHQLWHRNLQDDYGNYTVWWGHANSPVIFGKNVISVCMQDSLADIAKPPVESYIVAHDLMSGPRAVENRAGDEGQRRGVRRLYDARCITEVDGQPQMIVMGGNQVDGYDPANGKQLWYLPGIKGGRTVTGPTVADGLLYVTQGKERAAVGDQARRHGRTRPPRIVWKYDQGTPDSSTPVVWENHLFAVTDGGIARAFDAHSGRSDWVPRCGSKEITRPRRSPPKGAFISSTRTACARSSPARSHPEKLAENEIDDETIASPADLRRPHLFPRPQGRCGAWGRITRGWGSEVGGYGDIKRLA